MSRYKPDVWRERMQNDELRRKYKDNWRLAKRSQKMISSVYKTEQSFPELLNVPRLIPSPNYAQGASEAAGKPLTFNAGTLE